MQKEPKYMWREEDGAAICIIYYKDTSFCGTAECAPQDRDFLSQRTGEHIAYLRAYIDFLKYIRDYEKKPYLDALTHLYGTMQHSSHFNPKSYESRRLKKEIKNAQDELEITKELIDMTRTELREYINDKDAFYIKQRKK